MRFSADDCAGEVLDVAPLITSAIRAEIRRQGTRDLTVPQVRTLSFLQRCPGASLSAVAEHLGLTLPAMSKLMDGLVARKLVTRQACRGDRRCVSLRLTPRGGSALAAAREASGRHLAERLGVLSQPERATVMEALRVLRPLFTVEREALETKYTGEIRNGENEGEG